MNCIQRSQYYAYIYLSIEHAVDKNYDKNAKKKEGKLADFIETVPGRSCK